MTYITPDIEVHFRVLVDEKLGDTVLEVTSPKYGEKKRVSKRVVALRTSYIVGDKPKH